jgi:hypothetical protein
VFKRGYLPYRESLSLTGATADDPGDPALRVLVGLLPAAVEKVYQVEVRLDRRVAALRVVEALRLHAAAHSGKLPGSLAELTEVPIPPDPATGKPFEYRLDGSTASLSGPPAGMPPPWPSFKVTVRN